MKQADDSGLLKALDDAKPNWQVDGLGIRGNNQQGNREQQPINFPRATLTPVLSGTPPRAPLEVPTSKPQEPTDAGAGANFSFRLTDATDEDGFKVLVQDGSINDDLPVGMGAGDYILDVAEGADKFIYVIVTYDEDTLEITSRTLNVATSVPDSTIGTLNIQIGYATFETVDETTTMTVQNTHCGDINFTLIYGALNGLPALTAVASYSPFIAIDTP